MKCPRDGTPLRATRYEGDVEVDACPSCQGTWLDQGELEQIEELREHDYAAELAAIPNYIGNAYELARQKKLPHVGCPKCGETMATREYGYCSQVLIDYCPNGCGIWLDRGEVEALEVFFERSRVETPVIRRSFWQGLKGFFG